MANENRLRCVWEAATMYHHRLMYVISRGSHHVLEHVALCAWRRQQPSEATTICKGMGGGYSRRVGLPNANATIRIKFPVNEWNEIE